MLALRRYSFKLKDDDSVKNILMPWRKYFKSCQSSAIPLMKKTGKLKDAQLSNSYVGDSAWN